MTDARLALSLPLLDDMLRPLLLAEEREHTFHDQGKETQELRHNFYPITCRHVYLNHAAVGPLPRPVARILHEYIDDTSHHGGLNAQRWQEHQLDTHRRLATLLKVRPDQIALTASTGDGLMHIAQGLDWQDGDTIVTAEGEFPSNVYPWLNLQELGVKVHMTPMHHHRITAEDVCASIDERTRLVSLSLVEFSTGLRNDIATIATFCHKRGIVCGIDAIQAMGSLDVNVQALGVDYVVAAAHKWLLGPHITGILYVSDDLLARLRVRRRSWISVEEPFNFFNYQQPLKEGAARFEHSSPNSLPIVGLGASLSVFERLEGGMQAVEARILGITDYAIAGLERLGYPVISPQGQGERSGIVCFMPPPERSDLTVQAITDLLAAHNISVAVRGSVVRVSPHFYNTLEEIDTLLNTLEEIKR